MQNLIPVTCPWCRTNYSGDVPTNCKNCGGNLPSAITTERGAPPPLTPRVLPEKFKKEVLFWKNTLAFIGLIFMIIGFPLIAVFGFGLIFFTIGFFLYRAGKKAGLKKILALEHGLGCEGEIIEIGKDYSESVNGRNPFVITYRFLFNNQSQIGSTKTWDNNTLLRKIGDPLWIVYSEAHDGVSSIWPPLV